MRYLANIHFWYEGEMEDRISALSAQARSIAADGSEQFNQHLYSKLVDEEVEKHTKEFVFEMEDGASREQVIARAKVVSEIDFARLDEKHGGTVNVTKIPYLTIRELLKAPVSHTTYSLWEMESLLPEDVSAHRIPEEKIEASGRVRIDYYGSANLDGTREWALRCIFFDNEPVAVLQTAGRSTRDHSKTFLVSRERLFHLGVFLRTLLEPDDRVPEVGLDEEHLDLCVFYGMSITDIEELNEERQRKREARMIERGESL